MPIRMLRQGTEEFSRVAMLLLHTGLAHGTRNAPAGQQHDCRFPPSSSSEQVAPCTMQHTEGPHLQRASSSSSSDGGDPPHADIPTTAHATPDSQWRRLDSGKSPCGSRPQKAAMSEFNQKHLRLGPQSRMDGQTQESEPHDPADKSLMRLTGDLKQAAQLLADRSLAKQAIQVCLRDLHRPAMAKPLRSASLSAHLLGTFIL